MIDLSQLPAPNVIETLDFEQILAARKARLVSLYPAEQQAAVAAELELESDPRTKLLQENAYEELVLRQRINDAARAVMLAYAMGGDLDNLAALLETERLPGESDARLRARAQLAPEGTTGAGPRLAYRYHALGASVAVRDVYIDSPVPGTVRVTLLAEPSAQHPSGVPAQGLLDAVATALNADDVRPICDEVVVVPASVVLYGVEARLTTLPGPDREVVRAAALAACQRYVEEQFRLGYDVTVSGLHAALHQPGVMRVDLLQPATPLAIGPQQAALCTGIAVTLGEIDT